MISKDDHSMEDLTHFAWTINESCIKREKMKRYRMQFTTPADEIEHHVRRVIDNLQPTFKEGHEA